MVDFQDPGDIVIAKVGDKHWVLRSLASLSIADLPFRTARNP
jgi:hypothetical protein